MNDFLDLMPTKQAILSSRELNQVVIDFFQVNLFLKMVIVNYLVY